MKSINLNDLCRVKLTKEGIEALRKHTLSEVPYRTEDFIERVEQGEFQLWELMQIFGSSIGMGLPIVFENNSFELL